MWFHQDLTEDYGDFRTGLELLLESLSPQRRVTLSKELREFLDANASTSSRQMRKLWLKLGASAMDPDQDIRDTLEEVHRRLQGPRS